MILMLTRLSSLKAGKALATAGGALGGSGAVAAATGAAGVGLVTAGVARLSWKVQTFGINEIIFQAWPVLAGEATSAKVCSCKTRSS